jgi:hypothetical protein
MLRRSQGLITGVCFCLAVAFTVSLTGPMAEATGLIAEDLDHDEDVDSLDFALLRDCLSGSGVAHDGSAVCTEADIDWDGDVDMVDFGVMQECFSGTGIPGKPDCGGWCVRPRVDLPVGMTANPVVAGGYTIVTVGDSQAGVDYQLRLDGTNTAYGDPVPGAGGIVYLPTNRVSTATTFNVLAINVGGGCSVQLNATATLSVVPYIPKNKIGVHVNGSNRNGYGPFIMDTAAAGKPVAVVKCYADFGGADEPEQYSPGTLLMGRVSDAGGYGLEGMNDYIGQDAATFAQMLFNNGLHEVWDAHSKIQVWEVFNEWDAHYDWQSKFLIKLMDLAEAANPPHRVALFGCASGTPPQSAWPYIADACRRAKAHGNHVLALHEYPLPSGLLKDAYDAHPEDLVLRYRKLYRYLSPRNADCPLVITEVAQGAGGRYSEIGLNPFVQDFGWYDDRMREDPYVIGCCAFTLGGNGWAGANFAEALPALTNYIVTH